MLAMDKYRDRAKLLQLLQISASTSSCAKFYWMLVINYCTNILFSYFSNSIIETLTSISQHSEEKQVYLIKKSRYFNYKQKGYTAYNCLSKKKIAAILESVNKHNKNQEKK